MVKLYTDREVIEMGKHVLPLIVKAMKDGFDWHLSEMDGDMFRVKRITTRRNEIHDYQREKCREYLKGVQGVHCYEKGGVFFVGLEGKVTFRLKKVDSKLKSANIITQQSLSLNCQQTLPVDLFGNTIQKPTLVEVGYLTNNTASKFQAIYLICKDTEGEIWWHENITGLAAETETTTEVRKPEKQRFRIKPIIKLNPGDENANKAQGQ